MWIDLFTMLVSLFALGLSVFDIIQTKNLEVKWKNKDLLNKLFFDLVAIELPTYQNSINFKEEKSIESYTKVLDKIFNQLTIVKIFDETKYNELLDLVYKIEQQLEIDYSKSEELKINIGKQKFDQYSSDLIRKIISLEIKMYK